MTVKCPKCQTNNPDTLKFCGECGTQLPLPKDIEITETMETPKEELTTGSTFAGRYQIIEELGRGGMGKVYKVLDKEVNAKIALKLIKPEIASDKKTIERFRNELKVARDIAHKNVCRMYDLGKEEGAYYITMEYVSGEDLKSFIRRSGVLSVGKAISIANQVCEGLIEAHRLGVVHRDLKPQNIMIDKDGNARIMDFGIARSLRAKGITGSGIMIGTPDYMSPEQVDGKEADQRADVYSLGVILYEMVTGRVPFEGDTPFSIGVKQKSEIPRAPKEINEQIPEDLNRMILKCLEKDKERRYQSAGELYSELMNLEKGIPTTERVVPERKPITSREITVQFSLKKLYIPTLAVIAVIVVGLILWHPWSKEKALPLAPSDKPSIAVMYFENNTGDENMEHWRKGISDLLITDLNQSKYLKILGSDRLYNILNEINQLEAKSYSSEVLKEVSTRGKIDHILRGNYSKAGDILRIDVVLQNALSGEPILSERVEGKGEESIFSMVDELTRRVKESFKFSKDKIASDIDSQIGTITTSSPEAYKYYVEGDRLENVFGDIENALPLYKKAVSIDPEFASAFLAISIAYWKLGYYTEYKEYMQMVFDLKDRVSLRERYIAEAEYYSLSERTFDKAIKVFNDLLEIYPDDLWGNNDLGWIYLGIEEYDKAIEVFQTNIKLRDPSFPPYQMTALSYCAKGMYDEAIEVLENYLDIFPETAPILFTLGRVYLYQNKLDLALNEAKKAVALDPSDSPNTRSIGYIYLLKGNIAGAEAEFQKYIESDDPTDKLSGLFDLVNVYMLQGKFAKAKVHMEQAIELANTRNDQTWIGWIHTQSAYVNLISGNSSLALKDIEVALDASIKADELSTQIGALYFMGLIHLNMKSLDEAVQTAEELNEIISQGMNRKNRRYYYSLLGLIELEKENFSKATEYFEEVLSLLSYQSQRFDDHAILISPLTISHYRSGELEKSIKEYERIISLNSGRFLYGDIYVKSFYMLGKIYEQQGNTAKAIEHYEKFLDLWKDADPGIDEVEDTKKRLAALRS